MRDIGQAQAEFLELALQRTQGLLVGRQLRLDPVHVGQDRRHILALALGLADALGAGVALRLKALGFGLQRLAPRFQVLETG